MVDHPAGLTFIATFWVSLQVELAVTYFKSSSLTLNLQYGSTAAWMVHLCPLAQWLPMAQLL